MSQRKLNKHFTVGLAAAPAEKLRKNFTSSPKHSILPANQHPIHRQCIFALTLPR